MSTLTEVVELGQAVWLDDLNRELLNRGKLKRLIQEDGLCGVTSNPAIFEKAIAHSHDYDDEIADLAHQGLTAAQIYDRLSISDVRAAADLFQPLYEQSDGEHGFVSLELNPHLAHDTEGSVAEGRRLWRELDRPNVLIKVPATLAGLPAIERLTTAGINVNVTLLFGLPRYRRVADAYLTGIEQRYASREPVAQIRSVASFFLSRIDVLVDQLLDKLIDAGDEQPERADRLRGKVAIACARVAYQIYKDLAGTPRWGKLAQWGTSPQRLLWASTGTKQPHESDVKYVEPLIGPETINTMPLKTLEAFRDHGRVELTLEQGLEDARQTLDELCQAGIDLDDVTQQLEDEGVEKFAKPYDSLMQMIGQKIAVVI